jgi:arylsulfatase A-like enzyme
VIRLLSRNTSTLFDLMVALLLSAAFLAVCLWWTLSDLRLAFANDNVTASLMDGQVFGPVLIGRLAWFAVALAMTHLSFGLLALGLTRLTVAAAPQFAAGRHLALILVWFLVLVALALMANATWYPASRFSPEDSWLQASWRGMRPMHAVLTAWAMLLVVLASRAFLRRRLSRPRTMILVSAFIVLLLIGAFLSQGLSFAARPAPAFAMPHVVIVGLDSLRDELAGGHTEDRLTPHIDAFLNGAHRFRDTISPLARTYPALISLLTGRHPVTSNARFNLMPRSLVNEGDSLGDALQARGYHSVYATDEVRFANFDETFGFDQLITPPVGTSDFIIGKTGDLPLVNLLSPTRAAAWMFPGIHANRAAHVTYRPESFVRRLDRELVVSRPGFFYIHLTLSHWPYSWAGHSTPTTPHQYRPAYRHSIQEVDKQFGDVWRVLERKGVLENAIVVVLSDHGEALGGPTDSMLRKTGTGMEIWDSLWGHGTSVMSPHQYSVLLAMRGFGRAHLPGAPTAHTWPVSLEDVRPTLQEFATGSAPAGIDGISLLPFLRDPQSASTLAARVRYTETDFNTPMVLAGKYNESGLIHEGAAYYEIVPETGWVQLRRKRLSELMSQKQRAAISQDSLLAAIPSRTDDSVTYLFTDRRSPLPRRLQGRPDAETDPEAARLWDALHARFPGEMSTISQVP